MSAGVTAVLAASGLALASTAPASADTTTDRVWIDADQTFYAYTAAGETLDVNFTPVNIKLIDANYEGHNQQATANVRKSIHVTVTAPDGTATNCTIDHGTPVSVSNSDPTPVANQVVCDESLTSTTAGAWEIDFTRGTEVEGFRSAVQWDITAKDAGGTAIPGRVWSDLFFATQYGRGGVDGQGWTAGMTDLDLWYLGQNGYIYKAAYKDFNGYQSQFLSDAFGVTTTEDSCISAYQSAPAGYPAGSADAEKALDENGEPFGISNGRCGPAYHIFFDEPAADLPVSASLGDGSTVFVRPDLPTTPSIDDLSYEPDGEGSFAGTFTGTATGFVGNAELKLDIDNDGTVDLTVPAFVSEDGTLTATWDGKDADGNAVPVTTQVKVSAQVSKFGEIHFLRDDVEYSGGLEVTLLRGLNPGPVELHWDDSSLAGGASGTEDGANRLCSTNPLTGSAGTGVVHGWAGCDPTASLNQNNGTGGSWGDLRQIDDWTYETYEVPPFVIQLGPLPTIEVKKQVDSRVDDDDQFTVAVSTADDEKLATATTEDDDTTATTGATGVLPDNTYTVSEDTTDGSNPITGYTKSIACVDGDGDTVSTGGSAPAWTVKTPESAVYVVEGSGADAIERYDVTCTITNVAKDGPTAGQDEVTVDQGEEATLNPEVTPGDGAITKAAFDNGETTKVVDGEGTWKISVDDDGNLTATFTPEDGFTGPVTQQKYTVTDEYGLTATSTLDVIIRPAAGDDSATINPNETATLTPEVTEGSAPIESAVFDNGETTKVVDGEGTWKIEVDDDGKVTATFTPEEDYDGPVTPQEYTVTDENDETATGNLSVEINQGPKAGDKSATINPNETATLNPTVTPGTGNITEVAFDNGGTTKVVPGEGTWKIELDDDGKVTATFTPEEDYDGPVTPQEYTVTDENGLTADGELSVEINDPPQAEDASEVIKPNETATLNPTVTPGTGDITDAKFDNGETEMVVPGEGTWKIELDDDGKVVATFTPEEDYDGPVTPVKYTVTDENGLEATAELSVTIVNPALILEKGYEVVDDANDNGINDPGDVIRWTFHVTNTGNTTLNDVIVDDPLLEGLGIEVTCEATSLEADAETDCVSDEYTITDDDAEAGSIDNVATATGKVPPGTPGDPEDPTSPEAEVEVPVSETPAPGISLVKGYTIVKDTNKNGINDAGDVVRWTFAVTNTGNVTLENVSVDDPKLDKLGVSVKCSSEDLLPGLTTTCTSGKYTITAADVKAGSIKNVATATGEVPEETPGNPEDPESPESEVEIPTDPTPAPSLDLVKKAHLKDKNGNGKADAGEKINYSFVVTNTGNVTLKKVKVNDPMLKKLGIAVTCTPTTLAPAAKSTCTADEAYTVTAQDVKNGKVHNAATATGQVPPGTPGNPDDPTSPKAEVDVPTGPVPATPGLSVTGGQAMSGIAIGGVLLLLAGAGLMVARRWREERQ